GTVRRRHATGYTEPTCPLPPSTGAQLPRLLQERQLGGRERFLAFLRAEIFQHLGVDVEVDAVPSVGRVGDARLFDAACDAVDASGGPAEVVLDLGEAGGTGPPVAVEEVADGVDVDTGVPGQCGGREVVLGEGYADELDRVLPGVVGGHGDPLAVVMSSLPFWHQS